MARGDYYENLVTGEKCVVLEGDRSTPDERGVVELTVLPGGAVPGKHTHSYVRETFEVLEGEVGFTLDGEEKIAGPGTTVEIPVGVVHDWWNAGTTDARVIVTLEPLGRFGLMIENLFGLARDGKTSAVGMPGILQLSLFATEFRPEIEFIKPPPAVQKALFAVLRPVAKARGLKARYPEYERPHRQVELPD